MPKLSLKARGGLNSEQTGGSWEPFAAKELQGWEEWEEVRLTGNHAHVFDGNLWVLKLGPGLFQTLVKWKGFCRMFQFNRGC